jgi:hypothetical protein
MSEQRRHQRIRFNAPPRIFLGKLGQLGEGDLENLSLSGLMFRTVLPLGFGETFGCEFSVFGSPLIDLPAVVVSKVGDLYGARFQAGPISELLIQDAIESTIASGNASALSLHDREGRKVMRVSGGLNSCLRSDFMHGLNRVGVAELDLSGVTDIDSVGLALCLIAVEQYQVDLPKRSPCVEAAWAQTAKNAGKSTVE